MIYLYLLNRLNICLKYNYNLEYLKNLSTNV